MKDLRCPFCGTSVYAGTSSYFSKTAGRRVEHPCLRDVLTDERHMCPPGSEAMELVLKRVLNEISEAEFQASSAAMERRQTAN